MELDDTPIAAEPHVAPPETGAVTGAETGAETGNHEVTEAREMQSDPVAAEIKADRDGKVNGGMLGAKQDAEEQRDAAQEEKKEDEKKFHESLEQAREEGKRVEAARVQREKEDLEHITTMRAALDDKKTREAFIRVLMERDNITREEAEKRTSDLERRLLLEEMEKKGQKLSEEQREELERLKKQTDADKKRLETLAKDGLSQKMSAAEEKRALSTQDVSVSKRAEDFSQDGSEAAKKPSVFDGSVPSGIKTDVALTSTYNANAAGNVVEMPQKPQAVAKQQMAVVAEASGGMGFG